MKLTAEQLKELSHGAEQVIEEQEKACFYRFTKEQQLFYQNAGNESFYQKSFATAGVRLEFQTDSQSLYLKVNIPFASTRSYFCIDILVDGEMIGDLKNFADRDMSGDYTKRSYPLGCFEKNFDLGCGVKNVSVYLPWSVPTQIEELSLAGGSFVKPIIRNKKMLVFGDSITQGYDTLHPSKHYISLLADQLQADVYNKAIGGEVFVPALADTAEEFVPEYIFVAYGTNDWSKTELDSFRHHCKMFYEVLSRKYPSSKIFALTPIWRKDYQEQHVCGAFSLISDYIAEVAETLENVYCLHGFDFVPHQEEMYGDLRLHPKDEGFSHYAKNVYQAIKKII